MSCIEPSLCFFHLFYDSLYHPWYVDLAALLDALFGSVGTMTLPRRQRALQRTVGGS